MQQQMALHETVKVKDFFKSLFIHLLKKKQEDTIYV